jgi:5-hydroxyisourate hydrolase-like protein (transthyretin family)
VCREILRVITAVQSELKLPPAAWPSVIDLVQSALNQSASDRLVGVAPLTAFTGLPADGILKAVLRKLPNQVVKVHTLQDARAQQVLQLESAKKALEMMHVSVQERRTKKQQDAIQRHNARTGVRPVNFHVGDYVLQAKLLRHRRL